MIHHLEIMVLNAVEYIYLITFRIEAKACVYS